MKKEYELYLKAQPDQIWAALTEPEQREKFNFGASQTSDWTPGATFVMGSRDGQMVLGTGDILEVDAPNRLVQTMTAKWSPEVEAEGASRLTWEITAISPSSSRLLLTHDQLADNAHPELYGGWPMILSGLKTWLELGEILVTPGSQRYAEGT